MRAFIDLSGKRFGRWTVVRYTRKTSDRKSLFLCLCDCGREKEVAGTNLRSGDSKSCGCFMLETVRRSRADLSGHWFNGIFVLWRSEFRYARERLWLCYCYCGTLFHTTSDCLKRGVTKSCGCLRRKLAGLRSSVVPGSVVGSILCRYKQGARYRGLDFDLSLGDFSNLVKSPCYYCGQPPSMGIVRDARSEMFGGIDRLDNDKGYVMGNVVSCCTTCNKAKRDMSYKDFLIWINRLIRHNTRDDVSEVAL
jgi:hypothetical protein